MEHYRPMVSITQNQATATNTQANVTLTQMFVPRVPPFKGLNRILFALDEWQHSHGRYVGLWWRHPLGSLWWLMWRPLCNYWDKRLWGEHD